MKVTLKRINKTHAKEIEKIISNKELLNELDYPFPITKEYISNRIEIDQERWKNKKAYKLVISINKKVVGQISLYNPNRKKDSYEIGYFIAKKYWNKGIATEAVKQILLFASKKQNVKKVWATTKRNSSSERVLIKNDFKRKGNRWIKLV